MDIVLYMFIQLLRSGAFSLSARIRPLSPYKWERVVNLSSVHDVSDLLMRGVHRQTGNAMLNISETHRESLAKASRAERQSLAERYALAKASLPGKRKNKALSQIEDEIRRKGDVTQETLLIFGQLIHNTEKMLNTGFHLRGIIDLGLSLRTIGDKVDYVLLDHWIEQVSIRRMSQLQASVLIDLFDFDEDEFPFVHHPEKGAGTLAVGCLPKMDMLGFFGDSNNKDYVMNNKNRLSKGIRRMRTYFRYSPSGSFRSMVNSLADGLSQIEE